MRCSEIVAFVSLEGYNTVFKLLEFVRACSHRLSCLSLYSGKVTFVKSELIVVIVILSGVAIVAQRSDGNAELINSCSIDLGELNLKAVVSGLLDTFDVSSGISGLYTDCVLIPVREYVADGASCILCSNEGSNVIAISFHHGSTEIFDGSAFLELEAPVSCTCFDRIIFCIVAGCFAVVADFLSDSFGSCLCICPECCLLFFCPK